MCYIQENIFLREKTPKLSRLLKVYRVVREKSDTDPTKRIQKPT